ncbi:MAG: spermidine/putrescine ABC transporter substrate-binding protein [Chloroflexaceae bacterium]|jgi:spermidine/putrescine transport system substrate-binding protein|nr:spermidine/putrescine ABC transporter substrate-binding protein [Chloroflexaceae bacterium]
MKRLLVVFFLLLPLLAACGGATTQAPTAAAPAAATTAPSAATAAPVPTAQGLVSATAAPAASPAAGGDLEVDRSKLSSELFFFNWSDYIDPAILEAFETEYGVKVTVDTFDANEDMLAKVRAGNSGYDLVTPSDYAVDIMWREGLIQELDKSLLPNVRHMDPGLLNKYFDEGNKFSLPYMYGITGIAYNKEFFPNGIDSWAAILEPANIEQFRGQFSMLDDERETPGAALKLLGKSLNETDPTVLNQARDILLAQKPFIAAYNSSDVNRKLSSGEYVMAHSWSGSAMQARNGLGDEFPGNPNINFVIPKEGGMIWMDNMVVLKDSPNAYTAHVFMNFLMRPEIAAQNTAYIGYLSPNKDAVPLLPQEVRDLYAEGFAPDAEVLKRLEWAVRNEQTTGFTQIWTEVKGQ